MNKKRDMNKVYDSDVRRLDGNRQCSETIAVHITGNHFEIMKIDDINAETATSATAYGYYLNATMNAEKFLKHSRTPLQRKIAKRNKRRANRKRNKGKSGEQ